MKKQSLILPTGRSQKRKQLIGTSSEKSEPERAQALLKRLKMPHQVLLETMGFGVDEIIDILEMGNQWLFVHGRVPERKNLKRYKDAKAKNLRGKIRKEVQERLRGPYLAEPRIFPNGIDFRSKSVYRCLKTLMGRFDSIYEKHFDHQYGRLPAWVDTIRTQAQRLQLIADLLNWRIKYEIGFLIKRIEADAELIGQIKAAPVVGEDFVVTRLRFQYANLLLARARKKGRFSAKSLKIRYARLK